MKFKTHEVTIPAKNKRSKPAVKTVIDKDVIIMTPVKLYLSTCYAMEGRVITLNKRTVK